jgi:DNA-binding HxlR family transcriptional regulator
METSPRYASDSEVYFEYRSVAIAKPLPSTDPDPTPPSMLALLDLLGRRWALRILWELRQQPASFQSLQRRCDSMSTSVLAQRLGELRESQLVAKDGSSDYALTESGMRLLARLDGIDEWTQEWARTIRRGASEGSIDRG